LNPVLSTFKESIFSQMTALAKKHDAINLSQGFPDFAGPSFITEAVKESLKLNSCNQYAPMAGLPILVDQLIATYKDQYDLKYNQNQITITNGATEAIMISALALLAPGDEVIVFEPFYDSYPAAIALARAEIKCVTLKGPTFSWDSEELESAFSEKTKLVFFNNPQNPSGRVFTREECMELASLCQKYDSYLFSDEVYEYLTFDHHRHIPMATIPGMFERTITCSSGGKTFGHTGFKVGWAMASEKITHALRMVHQFNVFSVNGNAQYAMAVGLKNLESYLPTFRIDYNTKRLSLKTSLEAAGLSPLETQGTYFTMIPLPEMAKQAQMNDIAFCQHLIENVGIATIPPSGFYQKSNDGQNYLRFCFAKSEKTLKQADLALKNARLS
jgi:aspartate/methionine/tyrosine aminotransferase